MTTPLQLFGPTQISSSRPSTMADIGGLGPGFSSETALGRGPATREAGLGPNFLQLQNTGGMRLEPGMQLRGRVLSTEGNNVTLRFGESELTATTELPLTQGQQVDLQVTGQQQGKWSLQLTGSQLFTQMSEEDVTSTLMQMNVPTTDNNVEVAKTMVSMGLPLQGEDLQELVQKLAQLPRDATPQDMMSAVFLKAGALPLTHENLQTLATFITEHPFIGAQLLGAQGSLRRLLNDPNFRGSLSDDLIAMLEEADGVFGENVLDPLKLSGQKSQKQLQNMAFQAGIESLGPHGGDDTDMQEWLRSLRERIYRQSVVTAEMGIAAALLSELDDSIGAMRLMNAASSAEQGSFYFQIPLKPGTDTAEARLIYHVDSQGRAVIDAENAVLEIFVPTQNMGCVSWQIVIRNGCVALDAAVDTEVGRAAIQHNLPVLMAALETVGYEVATPTCRPRQKAEQALPPIKATELEKLERVNIQW